MNTVNSKLLFVNGVENTEEEVAKIAEELRATTGLVTQYVYNPHRLSFALGSTNPDTPHEDCVKSLEENLFSSITNGTYVCLILHSDGTRVGLQAIRNLKKRNQSRNLNKYLTVYGYGGLALFPKDHGILVTNYIHVSDMWLKTGSHISRLRTAFWQGANELSPPAMSWKDVLQGDKIRDSVTHDYNCQFTGKAMDWWQTLIGAGHQLKTGYWEQLEADLGNFGNYLSSNTGPKRIQLIKQLLTERIGRKLLSAQSPDIQDTLQRVNSLGNWQDTRKFLEDQLLLGDRGVKVSEIRPLLDRLGQCEGEMKEVESLLRVYSELVENHKPMSPIAAFSFGVVLTVGIGVSAFAVSFGTTVIAIKLWESTQDHK